jgi:RNA polymerase sigma-70 factor (ECF subfamily)
MAETHEAVREAVAAARGGDEDSFRRAIEPFWAELHAHCYRLLASKFDADDALQDALLRAWRGLERFDQTRPLRPWLYKIATNVCLDILGQRQRRILPFDATPGAMSNGDAPLPESAWISPYPDQLLGAREGYASPEARFEQREAVELAFVAALQHLPARQRAILVLRDVLGFSVDEIVENLDSTVASVNSALQRARHTLGGLLPDRSQTETLRVLGDHGVRDLARRFVDAFENGDVEGVIALLDGDASFAMPPYTQWCRGREAVSSSWLIPPREAGQLKLIPVRANGQLAFAAYRRYPDRGGYIPVALDVLSLTGSRITSVVAFRNTQLFELFDLPERLPLS